MSWIRPGLWLAACCGGLLPAMATAAVSCSVSATGVAFGVYDPLNAAATLANGQATVSCTQTGNGSSAVNFVMSLSKGSGNSYAPRAMFSGTNLLSYNIFGDASYTQVVGDGTGGSQTISGQLKLSTGNPTRSSTSILYGRVDVGQDVPAGGYADTITVTVTY